MRDRATPLREAPDRAPYVRVRAVGRSWTFRVPSVYRWAEIARAMGPDTARLLERFKGGLSVPELVAEGPALIGAISAVIGAAWYDRDAELSTPMPSVWNPEALQAYGAEVYEELHEAGWAVPQLLSLFFLMFQGIAAEAELEREVAEKATFFGQSTGTPPVAEPTSTLGGPASPPVEG